MTETRRQTEPAPALLTQTSIRSRQSPQTSIPLAAMVGGRGSNRGRLAFCRHNNSYPVVTRWTGTARKLFAKTGFADNGGISEHLDSDEYAF